MTAGTHPIRVLTSPHRPSSYRRYLLPTTRHISRAGTGSLLCCLPTPLLVPNPTSYLPRRPSPHTRARCSPQLPTSFHPPSPRSLDGNQPTRFGTYVQNWLRPFLLLRGRWDWRVARRASHPSRQSRTSITPILVGKLYDLRWSPSLAHTPDAPSPAQPDTPAAPCLRSARIVGVSRDETTLAGPVPSQSSSPRIGTDVRVPHTTSHAHAHAHPFRISHRPSLYLSPR